MNKEVVARDLRAMLIRLDALHDKIEIHRTMIRGALEVFEHGLDDVLAEVADFYTAPPQPDTQAGHVSDGIYNILLQERPLHRGDILNRLKKMGYQVGGKKPIDSVSAHLSNDPRFKSAGDGKSGTWTLTTEPTGEGEQTRLGQNHSQDIMKVA